jgi:hypothetical protein
VFAHGAAPITLAVFFSVFGTLLFGMIPHATDALSETVVNASSLEGSPTAATRPVVAVTR